MSTSHQLVVIRHSKAESSAATDFERVLTSRGEADATDTGRWLGEQGVAADAALVSRAARAHQTWEMIAPAAGWGVAPHLVEAMYGGDEYDVVERVTVLDEAVQTLVVIGHNPTMHALAALLSDGEGDRDGLDRLATSLPTSAAAVFDVPCRWADLGPGTCRLRSLYVGRG